MKNYTKLDELKSENNKLKTKIKKLEDELESAKFMIGVINDINRELINKVELYEKENKYDMKEKLLEIINHYGLMKQLKYIHSEYFELDEAIIDYNQSGWDFDYEDMEELEKQYTTHIAEEIADVMVMLKQFQYYHNIKDEQIENIMKTKIKRQLERINLESKGEQ